MGVLRWDIIKDDHVRAPKIVTGFPVSRCHLNAELPFAHPER